MIFCGNAVTNPGVGTDIGANLRVKLVAGAFANPRPKPSPRLIAADVIHVYVSIRNIHLVEGDNLQHTTYDTRHTTCHTHHTTQIASRKTHGTAAIHTITQYNATRRKHVAQHNIPKHDTARQHKTHHITTQY